MALGLAVLVLPHVVVAGIQLSPMDLAKAQSDARANLVAEWSGLAIGVAGVGTYLTYRLNRRGQVTERFGKVVDQLESESRAVRSGGLYTDRQ